MRHVHKQSNGSRIESNRSCNHPHAVSCSASYIQQLRKHRLQNTALLRRRSDTYIQRRPASRWQWLARTDDDSRIDSRDARWPAVVWTVVWRNRMNTAPATLCANLHRSKGRNDYRLVNSQTWNTPLMKSKSINGLLCPAPLGGALSNDAVWRRLSVAYIGPKSRTERPRKTQIGTEVTHVIRDSDTTFKVKRLKVKVTAGGGILWRLPHSLFHIAAKGWSNTLRYNKILQ